MVAVWNEFKRAALEAAEVERRRKKCKESTEKAKWVAYHRVRNAKNEYLIKLVRLCRMTSSTIRRGFGQRARQKGNQLGRLCEESTQVLRSGKGKETVLCINVTGVQHIEHRRNASVGKL